MTKSERISTTSPAAIAAPTHRSTIVRKSPERIKARTMNVTKNISAAPRSRMRKSRATHTTQKIIYFVSERVV